MINLLSSGDESCSSKKNLPSMSLLASLGRAATRKQLALKVDRALVRTVASLSAWRLAGMMLAGLVALMLSPLIVAVGFGYCLTLFGRAIVRQANRGRLAGRTSVMTRIGDRTYRLVSDDDYLARVEGSFEPEMCAVFSKLIRPTDIVLDVGANIGCTSILFSGLAAKVYSFEPSPTTYRFLAQNLAAAGATNVAAFNCGLGSARSTETLTFSPNNRSGGFVSNKLQLDAGHQNETVTIADGDSFFAEHGIDQVDFIKIDVEGFELEVLAGLTTVLQSQRPVVVLEMNHWCLNAFQRITIPEFIDALAAIFPVLYALDGTELMDLHDADQRYLVTLEHITKGMKFQNLIGGFDAARMAKLV